jgi:3-methyladenine DNA glycosylase AlkD
MTISDYLNLGDLLIATGKLEEASFASLFIASKKDEFSIETFDRVGKWLEKGIQNWASTDELCMLVLSEFIYNNINQPKDFINWTKSESKWKRRAVPVTFYEAIKKGHSPEPVFSVIGKLMEDKEEDVQKGLGTLLREIWKTQPEIAEEFLLKWKDKCGRKIIHYATEKMDKDYKVKFKKTKK